VKLKDYAQGQFGRFWLVAGPCAILGVVAGCARTNRGSRFSKNLWSGVKSFASAKIYVRLSRKR